MTKFIVIYDYSEEHCSYDTLEQAIDSITDLTEEDGVDSDFLCIIKLSQDVGSFNSEVVFTRDDVDNYF